MSSIVFTNSTRLAESHERHKACDLVLVLFHLLNLRGPDIQRTGTGTTWGLEEFHPEYVSHRQMRIVSLFQVLTEVFYDETS